MTIPEYLLFSGQIFLQNYHCGACFFTDLEAATLASQTTTTKSSSYAESKSSGQRLFSSGGRGFESMTSANSHQIAAAAQIGQHRLLQNGAGKIFE